MRRGGIIILAVTATTCAGGPPMSFTEVALEIGIDHTHVFSDAFPGLQNHAPGGVAADFDRDGDVDLFVVSGGVTPDRLFINDGTGVFEERTAEWGLVDLHMGMGAAAGDYDGDGWLDVYVTSLGPGNGPVGPGHHRLYRNERGVAFSEVAEAAGVNFSSPSMRDGNGAAFGDYDLDGDLDLFVAGWTEGVAGNRLFRNNGDGTFTDVNGSVITVQTGLNGFSPTFADMNGDRFPELLLAADYGSSKYFRNEGGTSFLNITPASGTGLDDNGMGSVIADLDNDGHLDWYVSSIWTLEGQGSVPGTGNMLYVNQGDDTFLEVAGDVGARDGGWGWGTVGVDLDHDTRLDLVETNGWDGWASGEFEDECIKLFHQQPDGTFDEVAHESGLTHEQLGRGLIHVDLEGDGDRDLIVLSHEGSIEVFRNDLDTDAHWLTVWLDTSADETLAPDGFGSVVTVCAGGAELVRMIDGGCTYLSTSETSAHFGLGGAGIIDTLRVTWNDGRETELYDVAVDQTITVGAPPREDVTADGRVDVDDLIRMLVEWGPCDVCPPACLGDVDGDCDVDVDDLIAILVAWE